MLKSKIIVKYKCKNVDKTKNVDTTKNVIKQKKGLKKNKIREILYK